MATRDFVGNNFPAARALRSAPTETEALLWEQLRSRRLDGLKFRRQHPIGRFVLDFYCDQAQLAVEVDGAIHLDPEARSQDAERQALLEERGIRFVRFTASEIETSLDRVLTAIISACTITPPLHASGEGAGG
ncbi:MAG: endonuclease domain-containing protein [Dehalococcoidia bacterium]